MQKNIRLMFVLLLLPIATFAQNATGFSIQGMGSRISGLVIPDDILAKHGSQVAVVKIQTPRSGLSFSTPNGVLETRSNDGEYVLYLAPSVRKITIGGVGYTPFEFYLLDFGIRLNKGEGWTLVLAGGQKSDLVRILLKTDPANATIFVDGQEKGTGAIFQVSPGNHTLKLVKSGFKTLETTFEVASGQTEFEFNMTPVDPVLATIKSIPTGATVFLNGAEEGKTDFQTFKSPGKYLLKAVLAGFDPVEREIELIETQENTFEITLSKTVVAQVPRGNLQLTVSPLYATVKLISGEKLVDEWVGSKYLKDIPAGNYILVANNEGYAEAKIPIRIETGVTAQQRIDMVQNAVPQIVAQPQPTPEPRRTPEPPATYTPPVAPVAVQPSIEDKSMIEGLAFGGTVSAVSMTFDDIDSEPEEGISVNMFADLGLGDNFALTAGFDYAEMSYKVSPSSSTEETSQSIQLEVGAKLFLGNKFNAFRPFFHAAYGTIRYAPIVDESEDFYLDGTFLGLAGGFNLFLSKNVALSAIYRVDAFDFTDFRFDGEDDELDESIPGKLTKFGLGMVVHF